MYLTADSIKVESDERGFELHISSLEEDTIIVNVHGIALDLLAEVKRTIGAWWAEGQAVRHLPASAVFKCSPEDIDESGGYDRSDPKHDNWHSVHSDIWDSRAGK